MVNAASIRHGGFGSGAAAASPWRVRARSPNCRYVHAASPSAH